MMPSWKTTVSQNASSRIRRGPKYRNGTRNSIKNIAAHDAASSQCGAWCAYQLVQVGSGWVSKWCRSADMFRHVSSPLNHLTSADQNIRRNSSQRMRNSTTPDGFVVDPSHSGGAKRIARKPASSSRTSHWKLKKSWHATVSDR